MNLMLNNKISPISLIPYLMLDDTGVTINLTADQDDDPTVQSSRPVFQAVSENNPFSKIIPAEIISGAGGLGDRAFLLTQKDIYTLPDGIEPLTNVELEKNWQQAFLYYSRNRLSNAPLILDDQIDTNGALVPFQPLWYCHTKRVYFHPLCPDCGEPLDQCKDDDLLIKHGLKPFSKSIQRYLYCPHCIEAITENAVFYVPVLGNDAPACLKGREDLIIGMGKSTTKEYPDSDFPCAACDHHPTCYGEEKKAVLRMAVFSFFPFYMMIFKTFDSNAVDLFSMISQPLVPEIENQEKAIPEADNALKNKASLESSVAKKSIQSILKNILQTWQKEMADSPTQNQQISAILPEKENHDRPSVPGREFEEAEDLDRTVIISSREDITKRMAAFAQKQDLDKTVVISKKDKKPPENNDADNKIKRQMEKTVIITADTMDKYSSSFVGHGQNNGQANNDQAMEKTVIINPKADGMTDKAEIIRNNPHGRHNNDDLDKTVIISPDKVVSGNKHVSGNKYASGNKHVSDKDAFGNLSSSSDRTIIFADDLEDAAHLTKKQVPQKRPPDDALEKTVIVNPNKK